MKRDKIYVVVGLALLVAALGAVYWWYFYTPLGRLVVDVNFEGIILDPKKCPENMLLTNVWKPDTSDISEMESKLEMYISRNRTARGSIIRGGKITMELRQYRRQYLGVLDGDGEKLIETFLCHKDIMSRRDWLLYHFDIAGGSGCDWSITYDVYTGTFRNLTINAEE